MSRHHVQSLSHDFQRRCNAQLFAPVLGGLDTGGSNVEPLHAIYPNQKAPVIVGDDHSDAGYRLESMRWGWPGFGEVKRPITNVRNLRSSFWVSALARPDRRCLVPVTAFCEWSEAPDPETGHKRQHWYAVKGQALFAFAGIWRPDEDASHFAFLTCAPNALVGAVHPKAMPVMLTGEALAEWMTGDLAAVHRLATAYPAERMEELA